MPTHALLPLLALVALLSACGLQPIPSPSGPGASERTEAVRRPKVLTIGIQRQPPSFNSYLSQGGSTTGGATQVFFIAHDYLIMEADRVAGKWEPRLAVEHVSVDKGTWRVSPDGTMVTTWTLRPNVKWQDGAPFTSADLLFSFTVYKDPEVPTSIGGPLARMASASAPDPLTFSVHWSSIYVRANEAPGLIPIPRHLLEDLYRTDKANLANSPRFAIDIYGSQGFRTDKEEPIIADGWKAVGAQVGMFTIPSALGSDREYRSKLPGVNLSGGVGFDDFTSDRLHSKFISSEATRWNGGNRGGYDNPAVDAILDRLVVTVAPEERLRLHRELLGEQMSDIALMPLYWQVDPVLARKGVRGFDLNTWNFFAWDKEA